MKKIDIKCRGCKLVLICRSATTIIFEGVEETCPCTLCLVKTVCQIACDDFSEFGVRQRIINAKRVEKGANNGNLS